MMLRIIELPPSTPSLYVPPGLSGGPLVVLGSVRPSDITNGTHRMA